LLLGSFGRLKFQNDPKKGERSRQGGDRTRKKRKPKKKINRKKKLKDAEALT